MNKKHLFIHIIYFLSEMFCSFQRIGLEFVLLNFLFSILFFLGKKAGMYEEQI